MSSKERFVTEEKLRGRKAVVKGFGIKEPQKAEFKIKKKKKGSQAAGYVRMEIAKGNLKKEGGRIVEAKSPPVQGPRNLKKGFGIKRTEITPQVLGQSLVLLDGRTTTMGNILKNVKDNELSKPQMKKLEKALPRYKEQETVDAYNTIKRALRSNPGVSVQFFPTTRIKEIVNNYEVQKGILAGLALPEEREALPKMTKQEQSELYGPFKPGDLFQAYDTFNERDYIYQLLHYQGRAGKKLYMTAVAYPPTETNKKKEREEYEKYVEEFKEEERKHPFIKVKEGWQRKGKDWIVKDPNFKPPTLQSFEQHSKYLKHFPQGELKTIKLENLKRDRYTPVKRPVMLDPFAQQGQHKRVIFDNTFLKPYPDFFKRYRKA